MNNEKSIRMENLGCTTIIVGKNATADGSIIVAHSDDGLSDARVIFVPGGKQTKGATRKVYYDNASLGSNTKYNSTDIRRYIGKDRGPGYEKKEDEPYSESNPLGEINLDFLEKNLNISLKKTYSYFDASYGIINEHGLMIGECTCGAKVHPEPSDGQGKKGETNEKKRFFYAAELSRAALETCKKTKEAIDVIAYLIKNYGLYGTGETLLIGDADEAWVMEMCGFDKDGTDGIWVAQRVPDDHFFVAANEFRIRDIHDTRSNPGPLGLYFQSVPPDDPQNPNKTPDMIYYSANLFEVCKKKKWIDNNARQLDWLPTVSNGEYGHPYYSLRRVWRAFSRVNPLLHLSPKVKDGYTRQYPFSIPVDPCTKDIQKKKKLGIGDITAIYRDHYEGTEFDLTVGTAAGPFGNPVRYALNPDQGDTFNLKTYKPQGAWERSISIYRCGILWINQAKIINNETVGISWIGLDRPAANCLMPFYCKMDNLPDSIRTMNLLKFEFDNTPKKEPVKTSAWWAFNFVANYINLNYSYMMKELSALQSKLEAEAFNKINEVFSTGNIASLKSICNENAEIVVRAWWELAKQLIVKYNDGSLTTGPNNILEKIDYPKPWLKIAGYYDGPTQY